MTMSSNRARFGWYEVHSHWIGWHAEMQLVVVALEILMKKNVWLVTVDAVQERRRVATRLAWLC